MGLPSLLVPEMSHSGEQHGDTGLVGRCNNFVVADRAAGLDDSGYAGFSSGIDTVAEREEGITGHYRTHHVQAGVRSLGARDTRGVHAAHLPGPDPHGRAVLGVDDGVGFDVLGHAPGEQQIL